MTVLAKIGDDLAWFTSPEKLTSYAGLAPSHRNSTQTVRIGSSTKRGLSWLRTAMVKAAFVAVRHDPRLKTVYEHIAGRRGPMKPGLPWHGACWSPSTAC